MMKRSDLLTAIGCLLCLGFVTSEGACGGSHHADSGAGGGGGDPSCTIPKSQVLSEPCCPSLGIDACGAELFCAALDGRTQATCYPNHSRHGMQTCTGGVQCLSGVCENGYCVSAGGEPCSPSIGCVGAYCCAID